jgi:hypothetical protein
MFGLGGPEIIILACLGLMLAAGIVYMFMRRRD